MSRVAGAKRPGNNVFSEVTETRERDTYPTFRPPVNVDRIWCYKFTCALNPRLPRLDDLHP